MQLFRAGAAGTEAQLQQVLGAVQPRVSAEMNAKLMAEFTEEEVKNALDSIGDLKAPGPLWAASDLLQILWDVTGGKQTQEVLHALNAGQIPESWNETTIALIPKVEKPEKVTELRPISL